MHKKPLLQNTFMLTDKGYSDLKKGIAACTLTNFSMMLPFMVSIQMILEIIKPLYGSEISYQRMWLLFGLGIVSAIIIFLCSKLDYVQTYVASYNESEKTRTSLAEHIRKLPMSVFNSKDLSEITTNLMGDVATSEHVMSHVVPQLFSNMISITVICIMMAFFDWRMALAVFISVPVALLVIVLSRSIYGKLNQKHNAAKLAASEQVQEYIEGIKVIRACNMDGEKFDALEKALRKMMKLAITMELGTGIFVTGAQVLLQAGIGLTVFVGANLLTSGTLDFVSLIMFLLIVVRIYGPVLTILTLLPELFYFQIAIGRMKTLMSIDTMEGDTETELTDFSIDLQSVEFRYNESGDTIIHDFSAHIPPDGITALVGPSGSGKSTITRLIARFWDTTQGNIQVGGIDIKTLDPEHLMSYMSFVFQDVILFHDTVFNNIKIGDMNATDEQVREAARAARCDEFINALPHGYDSVLGENGSTLSGGERQRISIARALLKNAPIILLDEATASLDPENESLIQEAISTLIQGKTVVVIAHRLRTVAQADHILVLENGHVAEQGTHDTLLAQKGLYHKLYTIQQESLGWSV